MNEIVEEKFKIILEYIKDLSVETPSASTSLSVREKLETQMISTYNKVATLSRKNNISYRMACYKIALERINSVYLKRGGKKW